MMLLLMAFVMYSPIKSGMTVFSKRKVIASALSLMSVAVPEHEPRSRNARVKFVIVGSCCSVKYFFFTREALASDELEKVKLELLLALDWFWVVGVALWFVVRLAIIAGR